MNKEKKGVNRSNIRTLILVFTTIIEKRCKEKIRLIFFQKKKQSGFSRNSLCADSNKEKKPSEL